MHGISIRRWSGLAVVLAISSSPLATASPPPSPAAVARARAEVQALLAAQTTAWNRGDLPAFVAGYAADATFVSTSGLTRGRGEVLARYPWAGGGWDRGEDGGRLESYARGRAEVVRAGSSAAGQARGPAPTHTRMP